MAVVFDRKLTSDDLAALAEIDKWLDSLSAKGLREAAEYFAIGVALSRPTSQSMAEWARLARATVK